MKGETILEVVIAISVGIIILTAVTLITLRALNNSTQSSTRTLATQYAQGAMEILRGLQENDWGSIANLTSNTYCMAEACTALSSLTNSCGVKVGTSCQVNIGGKFIREVVLDQNNSQCRPTTSVQGKVVVSATVNVYYSDIDCSSDDLYCKRVQLQTCLSNYDTRSAP